MRSFVMRLAIDTPIALDALLHLDGLLCARTARAGGQWDDIPLQQTDGVWHGSAAFLECGPFGPAQTEVVRVKHIRVDTVPQAVANSLPLRQRKLRDMSPERNRLTPHAVLGGIRALWFAGRGHIDRVADLASTARNLGSMAQTRYGHVTGLETVDVPDAATTGLLHVPWFPARTLPLDIWQRVGHQAGAKGIISMPRPLPLIGSENESNAFLQCCSISSGQQGNWPTSCAHGSFACGVL
jgi:hypothetical protein